MLELAHVIAETTDTEALVSANQELLGMTEKQLEADRHGNRYERTE